MYKQKPLFIVRTFASAWNIGDVQGAGPLVWGSGVSPDLPLLQIREPCASLSSESSNCIICFFATEWMYINMMSGNQDTNDGSVTEHLTIDSSQNNNTPTYPSPEYYTQLNTTGTNRTAALSANLPDMSPASIIPESPAQTEPTAAPQIGETPANIFWFIASAGISVYVWALFFHSAALGLGIVLLTLVHELGHYIVIKAKGLPAKLPIFIPLLGAFVNMLQLPKNVLDEAEIAIAGPIAGSIASAVCLAAYEYTNVRSWLILAYFGFFINALNLAPINPLDGGRIAGAISRWLWPIGVAITGWLFYTSHYNLLYGAILLLGIFELILNFGSTHKDPYYRINVFARYVMTISYVGLIILLVYGIFFTQSMLSFTLF